MLKAGESAPDFFLPDQDGKVIKLSDFAGQNVVVYFYPKDDTPGCTKEACGFRDSMDGYRKAGVEVLGISADDGVSHRNFALKYKLNFRLLSDRDGKVCRQWGVWAGKTVMGKEIGMIMRTTFVIGADGKVKKVFQGVRPEGHAEQVLAGF